MKSAFLIIDQDQDQIKMTKFPVGFDIRKHQKLADGILLKQLVFKDKGLKSLKLFNPSLDPADKQYLLLSTYTMKPPGKG